MPVPILPRRQFLLAAGGLVAAATPWALPRTEATRTSGRVAGRSADRSAHPVTVAIDTRHPGPTVPRDFAGLGFEVGPLNPGNAGVAGYFFSPSNSSLVTLFQNLGLRNFRVGGGSVDQQPPAGTGSNGYDGIDNLFAFARATGTKVIYTLRMFNPSSRPLPDLMSDDSTVAGYIWRHYRDYVDSLAISNEPDWHSFHTSDNHPEDPLIVEATSGVPGTAYPSYLVDWRNFAGSIQRAAPERDCPVRTPARTAR